MQSATLNGAEDLDRVFKNFPRQVAFASSRAVNDVAIAVQNFEVTQELPRNLTLRSKGSPWQKPGSRFGVNIKPFATASRPSATVGTMADWLRLQESGGLKRVSGHRVAVPTKFWKSEKELMAKSKKPRSVLNVRRRRGELAGRAFVYEGDKMPAGIYARNQRKSRAVRMLFRLVDAAKVPARLNFVSKGVELARQVYPEFFRERIKQALETAKLR